MVERRDAGGTAVGARVLVVDDDPPIRALLRRILERHEYRCTEAEDPAQARHRLTEAAFDLMLSDVAMPGESGLSLLHDVRAAYPHLPIVMVSGLGDPYLATAALDLGAYGYVVKPFDANQVLIAAANALRRGQVEAENRGHREALEAKVAARTAELGAALESLRRTDERRRVLLARLVDAQEDERRRIAAEVHDDAVQVMTAVNLRLEVLRRRLGDPEQADAALLLQDTVSLAIGRLRNLLFELSPPTLMSRGLGDAVRHYLEEQEAQWGMRWELVEDVAMQPAASLRTVVYRICQEALTNVRKHAGPCVARVHISDRDGGIQVVVRDDGKGCAVLDLERAEAGHLGLTSMHERARMAGGRCTVESARDQGCTVTVWVPLTSHGPGAAVNGT